MNIPGIPELYDKGKTFCTCVFWPDKKRKFSNLNLDLLEEEDENEDENLKDLPNLNNPWTFRSLYDHIVCMN